MREIDQRFVLEREAASGGMCIVYRALDRQTGKPVALKLLQDTDAESRSRFAREAGIVGTLDHPAIVRYVAHGQSADGQPYLALDWVDGETLQQRLERAGLSLVETVQLGIRLAEALGHAHERGVVHRDIKPTNLILPGGELARVSVLDFGIARPAFARDGLTETGAMVGTPAYMAPEQARGERAVGPAVDVFALGAVLYEALTGRRAFEGKHVLAVVAKVTLWDPPRPSALVAGVPAALDDLVMRMLAKRVELRPPDGNAVAAALSHIELPASDVRRPLAAHAAQLETRRTPAPAMLDAHRLASVVVAARPANPEPVGAYELEELGARLAAVLRPLEVDFEILHDSSVVAIVDGRASADTLLGHAIEAARAIRGLLPDAVVAIATGDVGGATPGALHTIIEASVDAVAREAMALAFAGVTTEARPVDAIRIDAATAQLVGPGRKVVRIGKALFVRSEAA